MKKLLLFVMCLIFQTSVLYAKEVKLTKLKVSSAKKVKVPKLIESEKIKLKLSDKNRYKERSLGSSVTYESEQFPNLAFNMFIYPMDYEISAEHLMAYEFHLLKKQLKTVYEQKDFKAALLHEALKLWGSKRVFFSKHTFHDENGALISESFLTHIGLHYIKVRISYPTNKSQELSQYTAELAQVLVLNTELKEKKNSKIQIQLSATDDETFNALAIRYQLIYALAMSKKISEVGMLLSFEDFKEVYNQIILITDEMSKKSEEEIDTSGYITLEDIINANMVNEYIWKFQGQPHWQKPEYLRLKEFEEWLKDYEGKRLAPIAGDHLLKVSLQD